jgi:hypothetical protein
MKVIGMKGEVMILSNMRYRYFRPFGLKTYSLGKNMYEKNTRYTMKGVYSTGKYIPVLILNCLPVRYSINMSNRSTVKKPALFII